ncbi:MAG: flagellar basal body rod protein FlgC [Thermodesulfobacteriota bacterium]|nr:flagellar basal body rod protein FlgC [Thermodesulfobacteriota bacterium]
MDLFTAMDISAGGLSVQRTRMNVISSNITNANTTRTEEGGPYQRRDCVLKETTFENVLSGVEVEEIVRDPTPGKRIYDPGNPDSDKEGYVRMPNVNIMEEMVNLTGTTRAFEANATVIKSLKDMALKALSIGG